MRDLVFTRMVLAGVVAAGAGMVAGGPAYGASDATIVPDPSWTCGVPGGIVAPALGQPVFTATMQIGTVRDAGTTQYGHRRVFTVKGGTISGPRVGGTVLAGGLDLELTLSTGSVELEQLDVLRLGDGTMAYLRSCGVAPAGDQAVRVVPDVEVANGSSYAWLGSGTFAGTRVVDTAAGVITVTVYDVSKVPVADPRVRLKDPAGVPNQSWECAKGTGSRGATVFSESVTLGSTVSVGAAKRGTRTIIPITGGTTTGRVTASVLSAGADYQLRGTTAMTLDARYVLVTKDGEVIVVRNCGPIGALVPTFETRADGPYGFLDSGRYLSSDPGPASGGVSITFYERV